MTSPYTKRVTKALVSVIKSCSKVYDYDTESNLWLGMVKGKSAKNKRTPAIDFVPDVYAVANNKVHIFQLCDSEASKRKELFGDFFTALLSPEVYKIHFFVPSEAEEETELICKIVVSILSHRFKLNKKLIPDYTVLALPKNGTMSDYTQVISQHLNNESLGLNLKN